MINGKDKGMGDPSDGILSLLGPAQFYLRFWERFHVYVAGFHEAGPGFSDEYPPSWNRVMRRWTFYRISDIFWLVGKREFWCCPGHGDNGEMGEVWFLGMSPAPSRDALVALCPDP